MRSSVFCRRPQSGTALQPDALCFVQLTARVHFLSQFHICVGKDAVRINGVRAELGCFAQVRKGIRYFLLHKEQPSKKKVGWKIVRVNT